MDWQNFAKEVFVAGGRYFSLMSKEMFIRGGLAEEWTVEYLVGEWVSGQGPLFISPMRDYLHDTSCTQYWRVETKNARWTNSILSISCLGDASLLSRFWAGQLPSGFYERNIYPRLIADEVKLIERVGVPYAAEDLETPL